MWWCSTQCHCVVFLLAILLTITDRGPIDRGARTRPSRACLSHEKGAESWRCRRSAACTIATSEAPPERPNLLPRHVRASFEICLPNWAEVGVRSVAISIIRPELRHIHGNRSSPSVLGGKQQSPLSYTAFSIGTLSSRLPLPGRYPSHGHVLQAKT